MAEFPKRFIGQAGFEYESVEVERIIIRSTNDMVIEFKSEDWLYTVNMKSDDGIKYFGEYIARKGGEIEKGSASGRLYTSGNEKILFGRWVEGDHAYWWVTMEKVDSF